MRLKLDLTPHQAEILEAHASLCAESAETEKDRKTWEAIAKACLKALERFEERTRTND